MWHRVLFVAGCLGATGAGAQNLVANPGFETADADGRPAGWVWTWQRTQSGDTTELAEAKQEPAVSFDEPRPGGGRRALKVAVSRAIDDGVWTQEGLTLPAGTVICRVSCWLKVADASGGTAQVGLVFLGAENQWLGAVYDAILQRETCDWRKRAGYVRVPDGTQAVRLRIWTNMRRSGRITVWYDDVQLEATDLTDLPSPAHRDPRPLPPLDDAARARGFVAWPSPITQLVFADTKPPEGGLGQPLTIVGTTGQPQVGTVALRGLQAVTVRASISDLTGPATIPADAIALRPARYLVRPLWARDARPLLSPRYLMPGGTPLALAADTSGWLWVEVTPPPGLPAGTYRGTLRLASEGGEQEVAVEARLYAIELAPLDGFAVGFYDNQRTYEGDSLVAKWRRQRAAGMTSVGFYSNFGGALARAGGQVTVDVAGSELAAAVAAYREAGFTAPFFWLMGRDVERFALEAGPLESEAFAADYLAVVHAILSYGQRHGWPELILQPADEVFEHRDRYDACLRLMAILRRIPDLRIEADGMNGNPAGLEEAMPLIDIFALHDGPFYRRGQYDPEAWSRFTAQVARQGGQIWFYNVDISGWRPEMGRFLTSWHPIRCGATGVYTWSWQSVVPDPYDPQQVARAAFMHEYPALGDEPGGPSPSLLAMRTGIEDHRLWLTARQRLAAGQGTPALQAAVAEVQAMLERIDYRQWDSGPTQGKWAREGVDPDGLPVFEGDLKAPTGWAHGDYDRIRELLLTALSAG